MIGNLIAVISASAAIIAALVTYSLYRITKRNLIYQVLVNLQMEYRSPEMQYAIMRLWDFYKECNKDEETLMKKYGKKYDDEKNWLKKQKEKPIEALKTTLDHQRRLVSQFYGHLAALYTNKIIPPDVIFATWSEKDLRIIPKIIIPMENKLLEILHKDSREPQPPPLDVSSKLYQLYIDSKDYE
jgi:hypothetical protein